jgi:BirA family biotin operon repressor/biotin-[acetyl-CoA-carboxylase] ligase
MDCTATALILKMVDSYLKSQLDSLPLGGWRYEESIGSTNDAALAWAENGAPDLSLVVADQQTLGRGRFQRRWITHPGAALAFSLILRPTPGELDYLARFSALGAVAIVEALGTSLGLPAEIKWPNDVLLNGHKAAGILVENAWTGSDLKAVIIGIGINVSPAAVPDPTLLMYPATSLETILGKPVDRWSVLHQVLSSLIGWRKRLASPEFQNALENRLAFKNQWVRISGSLGPDQMGQVIGIDPDGSLRLRSADGSSFTVSAGDVSLRSAGGV